MQENYTLVQEGFRLLLQVLAPYVSDKMKNQYHNDWWNQVIYKLPQKYNDLPLYGDDEYLISSLDVAACLILMSREWKEVFDYDLDRKCRPWLNELVAVRNAISHIGIQDLDQHSAERALDTMVLLCNEIDEETASSLKKLYGEVRSRAKDYSEQEQKIIYRGIAQPDAESSRGALKEGSLLQLEGTDAVRKTELTRKLTFGDKTVIYPVYKVRLDLLFYNDQNDRIATWISEYETENGKDSLTSLDKGLYNSVIQGFIEKSNPEAINKTQKNMMLVGQNVPGVTLADGRIVDGNRRFTCLRRIQRETSEPMYFETIIMDMDIIEDRKQIKLLELAIQHGEEKPVDYDAIDYAIGTYRDVVQTSLLTIEEYAQSANEGVSDVKKRIEIAEVINEFLEYIGLPEQYYAAREYQVYDLFKEMVPAIRKLAPEEQEQTKIIAFNNVIMHAAGDQRKFIRDIKMMIRSDTFKPYLEEQNQISSEIKEKMDSEKIQSKKDLEKFAEENNAIFKKMSESLENAMYRSRNSQIKAKPSDSVSKCITLLRDVDPRLFTHLDEEEKENLKSELDTLGKILTKFKRSLSK